MADNPKRHIHLLARGFYLIDSYSEGLRICCARILGKPNPSIEESFGILLPMLWKALVAAGEDKVNSEKDLSPGVLSGGSVYEFAELFMLMRKFVFNLDKNKQIARLDELQGLVYTNWDELFTQAFLSILAHRKFEADELGEPDPTLMPINQKDRKR